MGTNEIISNYSAVGDLITIIISVLFVILLKSTYTVKQKTLTIFYVCTSTVVIAAMTSIRYHLMIRDITNDNIKWIYIYSSISHISLMITMLMFCIYLEVIINMKSIHKKIFNSLAGIFFIIYAIIDLSASYTHIGLYIDNNHHIHASRYTYTFVVGYIFYGLLLSFIVYLYRKRFITKVKKCIERIMTICFLIMLLQLVLKQSSFTCITFLFPILGSLFLFHYNAYDTETGTLDIKSFLALIYEMRDERFAMIFMNLKDVTPQKIQTMAEDFFHFNEKFFVEACTFRVYENKMAMIYKKSKNPEEDMIFELLMKEFYELYTKYKMPYKIVKIDSIRDIDKPAKYLDLENQIEADMEWNSVHKCDEYDLKKFTRNALVFRVLSEIVSTNDLNDDRVKVYCQPVFNTVTGEFSTAEALMRIVDPEYGMIFPDEFIPIAEKYEYIHVLSKIILNKTCKGVLNMLKDGYQIDRVSVNFSMIELRDKNFCDDVLKIIKDTGLSFNKIAIELTESKNEQDYEMVKAVVSRLHQMGIKFYLDDFGTGYSNFERIIGLPIDIIKFDRSLTIMAGKDDIKQKLVGGFADIFYNSKYEILFEGIENDFDEELCKGMKADYLQGYKYSKPIPIDELRGFFKRA